jgi:uncharacterized protein (DUF58 family)
MIPKEILQQVRRIEIRTQSIVNALLSGEYKSVFRGQGMEFSEVRSYTDGDDIRSVDWNVTARMGEPFVKKHVEEREQTVMLLVDASGSGRFGSHNKMKNDIATELCAVLAFSAIKNNDRVGLITFTSEVEKFIPPKKGKKHVLRVIRELLYFQPRCHGTDIREALRFLNRVQRKKAVVFLVSDFRAPDFESTLRVASQRHDCIAVSVTDPRELRLPDAGLIELEDPETGRIVLADTGSSVFRNRYAKLAIKRQNALRSQLRAAGVDHIELSTASDYIEPLVKFFRKREHQLSAG